MMVPVNMRESETDWAQSACNIVSTVFLDRTPSQIRDRESLLRSIHEEMSLIKRNQLAYTFIASLWLNRIFDRRRKAMTPRQCQTSVVFTNLGKVFEDSPLAKDSGRIVAGDVVLEKVELLAPLAAWMCAAFSAIHYAGQLSLSLRFDARFIECSRARQLVELVVAEAESFCCEASES